MREFVGPNQLQFTDKQLAIVNRILDALPESLRTSTSGQLSGHVTRPDIAAIVAADPSESIRSGDVMAAAAAGLDLRIVRWTGGSMLHPLLNGIAWNFEREPEGPALLELLIAFDEILIEHGVLASDYCTCVGYKRT
jgi:hypothetical protein